MPHPSLALASTKFATTTSKAGRPKALLILHGLFGSQRNWRSIALALAKQQATSYDSIYTVDLPNHGDTFAKSQQGLALQMTWPNLADSLEELLNRMRNGYDKVTLMGHSLGGQVAMQSALLSGPLFNSMVDRLVVVDVAPKPVRFRGSKMEALLDRMVAIERARVPTRNEARAMLAETEADRMVVEFLLSNGHVVEGQFRFKLPLEIIKAGMHSLQDTYLEVPRDRPVNLPTLFVRGARSDFIEPSDGPLLRRLFPASSLVTVPDAGHWPHHQNQAGFLAALAPFLG
jgi:pimeloyl-ACP methyl ester carboxylesterase